MTEDNTRSSLHMNRRQVLAGAAGLMAAASFSAVPARAAARTPGGRFRLGMVEGQTTDTLDPQFSNTTFAAHINFQLRNCLVEIGPDFELVPELAESV